MLKVCDLYEMTVGDGSVWVKTEPSPQYPREMFLLVPYGDVEKFIDGLRASVVRSKGVDAARARVRERYPTSGWTTGTGYSSIFMLDGPEGKVIGWGELADEAWLDADQRIARGEVPSQTLEEAMQAEDQFAAKEVAHAASS